MPPTAPEQLPLTLAGDLEPELITRYRVALVAEETTAYAFDAPLNTPDAAATWALERLEDRPQEHMLAVFLNSRQRSIGWMMIAIGTLNRAAAEPRTLLQAGLLINAAGVILVHNHPSGDPTPSPEDLAFTERIREAGDIVGVRLIDHLITGTDGRWVSLRKRSAW